MLSKIWTITWKELYITFTDRNLLLIMIAVPLAISSIVGLAFGGLSGGNSPVSDIPVALINWDEGNAMGVNFGRDVFVSALVPPETSEAESESQSDDSAQNSLFDLTDTVVFDAALAQTLVDDGDIEAPDGDPQSKAYVEAAAKVAVDDGRYTAVIIIPPDFSQKMSFSIVHQQIEPTGVYVYANSGRAISAGIVRSIVERMTNQIASGNITIKVTIDQLTEEIGLAGLGQAMSSLDFQTAFAPAFNPTTASTVGLDTQTVASGQIERSASTQILVMVGASQAMFFALFTAQFGVFSLYDERRNWTLQRLIMSPTPRYVILTGKLVGVFAQVLFQLLALMVALSLVGSLMQGSFVIIWGNDFLRIALILFSAALAVSGLGMLLAGLARTPEQGNVYGSVANMGLAVLGGAFGFQLPETISQFSMIYWGSGAFNLLSSGDGDITKHVIILVAQGVIMFGIGLALFNRRFETV